MLKKYASPIVFLLGFSFLITVYYLSRVNGYHSDLEIKTWKYLYLLNNSNNIYSLLSSTAPLSLFNIINIYRLTFFNLTIFAPFFLGMLAISLVSFFNSIDKKGNFLQINNTRAYVLLAFILNPYVLNAINNDVLSLITALTLFLIFKGVFYYDVKRSSKGIFLIAIGLAVLLTSGGIGVSNFMSLFIFLPLLLHTLFKDKYTLGPLFLIAFPSMATIFGIFYLSWLANIDIEKILFIHEHRFINYKSLLYWTIFIPIIIYRIRTIGLNARQLLIRNSAIIIPLLAQVILITLDRSYQNYSFIAIALILTALNMLSSKSNKKAILSASLYLTFSSWLIFSFAPKGEIDNFYNSILNDHPYKTSLDYDVQNWFINNKTKKAIALSNDVYRLSMLDSTNDILTPISKNFQKELAYSLIEYDTIIISKEYLDKQSLPNIDYIRDLPKEVTDNYYKVFNNSKWSIYQNSSLIRAYSKGENTLSREFNWIFVKELLYFMIIFDLVILLYIFYKRERN